MRENVVTADWAKDRSPEEFHFNCAITFTHIYKTLGFSAPEIWLKYAEQDDFIDSDTSYHTRSVPSLPEYYDLA